jgi:UDP-glucose 4-epimerase
VAGIAHVSTDPSMESLYYSVNRDLPIAVAQKAKKEGVKQFIFMSSMIVYGSDTNITADTKPNPANFYGKSKLEAEEALLALADDTFTVTIIRTPMVYGQNCKGNFSRLIKLAQKAPIFPDFDNKRSMIYIDNLCAFILRCIENPSSGIVFPQNTEYVSTKDIIAHAAACMNRKIYFTKAFNPLIHILINKVPLVSKVFGTKTYDPSLSSDRAQYNVYTFEESIKRYFELTKNNT